jgi:hypothetical protein
MGEEDTFQRIGQSYGAQSVERSVKTIPCDLTPWRQTGSLSDGIPCLDKHDKRGRGAELQQLSYFQGQK